jgi:hypothetical protein
MGSLSTKNARTGRLPLEFLFAFTSHAYMPALAAFVINLWRHSETDLCMKVVRSFAFNNEGVYAQVCFVPFHPLRYVLCSIVAQFADHNHQLSVMQARSQLLPF